MTDEFGWKGIPMGNFRASASKDELSLLWKKNIIVHNDVTS
jgi:hypothetical protein